MKYNIGKEVDFSVKGCHVVEVKGRKIGIYKIEDTFYAISNTCPHKAGPLCVGPSVGTMLPSNSNEFEYGMEDRVVRCPWHGFEFEITTGEPLFGTSSKKAPVYPVSSIDGDLYIEL